MDGFFSALSASLVLLMLMSVGYFMGRLGWMTAAEKRFLSKFIVNIAVPCNCITGLLNNLDHDSLLQAGLMVASAMVGVAVTLVLSLLLAKLLRLPRERWGVFVAMAAFSNTLFIGLPVSTQLFGDVCVPYVMMYYLANTLFVQSAGILIVLQAYEQGSSRSPEHRNNGVILPVVLLHHSHYPPAAERIAVTVYEPAGGACVFKPFLVPPTPDFGLARRNLRMGIHIVHQRRKPMPSNLHIGVQQHHIFGRHLLQSKVIAFGKAPVFV